MKGGQRGSAANSPPGRGARILACRVAIRGDIERVAVIRQPVARAAGEKRVATSSDRHSWRS